MSVREHIFFIRRCKSKYLEFNEELFLIDIHLTSRISLDQGFSNCGIYAYHYQHNNYSESNLIS